MYIYVYICIHIYNIYIYIYIHIYTYIYIYIYTETEREHMIKQNQKAGLCQISKNKLNFIILKIYFIYIWQDILELFRIKFKSVTKYFINKKMFY